MNRNVEAIEISGIRKFYNKVSKVPEALSLTLGQPDFKVSEEIKAAMIRAIEEDKTTYTPNAGIYQLRKEICSYLADFNINYTPEEVCLTAGGSEALYSVLTALLNKGDRLLIPNPAYPAYESIGRILGAEIKEYPLKEDFSIDIEGLRKLLLEGQKNYIVLSFPSNPTGAVLRREDHENLYKLIKENNVMVITDDIYAALCYEPYYSVATYTELKDKIIYVSGFSKMFSMTGLRIGYICAEVNILKEIMKVHQYNVSCASSIAQYGALEGLKSSMGEVLRMREEFIKRRDFVYMRLKDIGFSCNLPRGAFYIFPSIKSFGVSSDSFCEGLLYEGKVACVPGTAFGSKGEDHIRISYCYSFEELKLALERIDKWVQRF